MIINLPLCIRTSGFDKLLPKLTGDFDVLNKKIISKEQILLQKTFLEAFAAREDCGTVWILVSGQRENDLEHFRSGHSLNYI